MIAQGGVTKYNAPRFLGETVVINDLPQPNIGRGTKPGQSDKHKYPLDNDTYLLVGSPHDEG